MNQILNIVANNWKKIVTAATLMAFGIFDRAKNNADAKKAEADAK